LHHHVRIDAAAAAAALNVVIFFSNSWLR